MAPLLHHLASTGFYAAAACAAGGAGEGEAARAVEDGMAGDAGRGSCSGAYSVHGLGVGRWAAAFEAIGQRLWEWARMPSATAAAKAGGVIYIRYKI